MSAPDGMFQKYIPFVPRWNADSLLIMTGNSILHTDLLLITNSNEQQGVNLVASIDVSI